MTIRTLAFLAPLLVCTWVSAQSGQWQIQINTPEPTSPAPNTAPNNAPRPGVLVPQTLPTPSPPPVQPAEVVQSILVQHDLRIRWAGQRGYLTEPEYRRLAQMQANVEHNRRIAYADGFFGVQEQQFVYGQLNVLSAEIDTVLLTSPGAVAYTQQFSAPVAVWVVNQGWVNGKYELKADAHHNRAYKPVAAQAPVMQTPQGQPSQPAQPSQRKVLKELLEGVLR